MIVNKRTVRAAVRGGSSYGDRWLVEVVFSTGE